MTKGVAKQRGATSAQGPNHRGDVVGQVIKRDIGHRALGAGSGARLRPQHAPSGPNHPGGDVVVVLAAVAAVHADHH